MFKKKTRFTIGFGYIQLTQLEDLTENEKIEIIKTYNIMFSSIENLIN
jgi:hypothetical protein